MRVLFDPDFDSGYWSGPLRERDAVFGEAWVGYNGLLNVLETQLGLGGVNYSSAERVAALCGPVCDASGFWRGSVEADPLGTSRKLLQWRDILWLAGWTGERASRRLDQLSAVTADCLPGAPDRLAAVIHVLPRRRPDIESIATYFPVASMPRLWREAFGLLADVGVEINDVRLEPVRASGDLFACRTKPFAATGDGSLQLLRPSGVLAAAEHVAAWLAAKDDLAGTVIIGADPTLDHALHRAGLPTTGARPEEMDNTLLQVLPLVVSLGWDPADPRQAVELLTLPVNPIPMTIRRKLLRALEGWYAVGSEAWLAALASGFEDVEAGEERARARERLALIFSPVVSRDRGYPVREIRRRLQTLVQWLGGNLREAGTQSRYFEKALAQCSLFESLLILMGAETLDEATLEWLLREASGGVGRLGAYEAEAGLASVQSPAAVAGPASTIVWWNFNRQTVRSEPSVPLTMQETQALESAGVHVLDPGGLSLLAAERWRRPLLQTSDALMLVCPGHPLNDPGPKEFPHPLWDEIVAKGEAAAVTGLVVTAPIADDLKKFQRQPRPVPRFQHTWRFQEPVSKRPTESPSSIGVLIGCSVKWLLNYKGKMHDYRSAPTAAMSRLQGSLIHELASRVLDEGNLDPEHAAAKAGELFDREARRMVSLLYLPGFEDKRSETRHILVESVRDLCGRLESAGLVPVSTEGWYECDAFGTRLGGMVDLTVGPDSETISAVIDLKLHGGAGFEKLLRNGTSFQLATYSHIISKMTGVPPPDVAYYILSRQRGIELAGASVLPGALTVDGMPITAAWEALVKGFDGVWQDVAKGIAVAPGVPDDTGSVRGESYLDDNGGLVVQPPCGYCGLGMVCGRTWESP